LKKIVEIASLQTSYLTLDECLKVTKRRVNALEYIVVPRIEGVLKYIDTELQERSKEEKFKIKKVLANKKKHKENEESLKEKNTVREETIFERSFEEDDEDVIDESERLFK
jgi:V-type H+-transporting ATPase subunit D